MTSPAQVPAVSDDQASPIPKWAYAIALVALTMTWLVLQENGVALGHAAETVHEFFHDGRHALGVPCH
ncbi:CbtB-domain containing protein [Saccharothrix sp. NRRL B-16314]|uniref:CbtB-domain containing protein n=1 Tax=Saccharothrix sp. NRRL B-16314 TaxID=1463825 RepID=UPI00052727BE|nr:CbtB-domain containing protein [Saccharothrix sp. NRRL B-16314]